VFLYAIVVLQDEPEISDEAIRSFTPVSDNLFAFINDELFAGILGGVGDTIRPESLL